MLIEIEYTDFFFVVLLDHQSIRYIFILKENLVGIELIISFWVNIHLICSSESLSLSIVNTYIWKNKADELEESKEKEPSSQKLNFLFGVF